MIDEISDYNNPEEVPGLSLLTSRVRRFHDCLDEVIEKHRGQEDDELYAVAVLEDLANGCHTMDLPQEFAMRMAGFQHLFGHDTELVKTVFQTAYLHENHKSVPLKYMRPSALLTYKTEAYMRNHYVLRLNIMTGEPEYKVRGLGYGFQPLDRYARNTMSINALKAGVDSWDKDMNRYIDSNLIPQYNPIEDYLSNLPRWDGRDRVTALARRIKTTNKKWKSYFHIWMLSMVAQWLGKSSQHGNAIVPLLIGPQGSGKTTFCRRLLPEGLQPYFNDRLSMKNDNDIFMAMSSYALINIDEFDAMSKSHQPILKYLLSKHDVKMRPPHGKAVVRKRRLASFIATTNNLRPLVDPTGSRRFVCIYADKIDNAAKINHNQIYTQLVEELKSKRRYWFTDHENELIMEANEQFQQVNDLEKMVRLTFMQAEETPSDAYFMSVAEIADILASRFTTFRYTNNMRVVLGRTLQQYGYKQKRISTGVCYQIVLRQ